MARPELFAPATQIVIDAGHAKLISDRDRDLILALIAAIERDGFLSQKAGAHGVQSAKGLVIAALCFLGAFFSGAVASSYSNESELMKKIGKFLAANETRIVLMLPDAPPDMRLAVQAALDALKGKPLHDPTELPPNITPFGDVEDEGDAP